MKNKLYAVFLVVVTITIIIGLISLFKPKTESVNKDLTTRTFKDDNSSNGEESVTNNTKNYKTSSGYSSDKKHEKAEKIREEWRKSKVASENKRQLNKLKRDLERN